MTRLLDIKKKYGLNYKDEVIQNALNLARKYMSKNVYEEVKQNIFNRSDTFKLCNHIVDSSNNYEVEVSDIKVIEYMTKEPYIVNDLSDNIVDVIFNHPMGYTILKMDSEYPSTNDFKLQISYLRAGDSYENLLPYIQRIEELLTIYFIFDTVEINALQRGLTNRSINDVRIEFDQKGIEDYKKYLMQQINILKAAIIPFDGCEFNSNPHGVMKSVLISKRY